MQLSCISTSFLGHPIKKDSKKFIKTKINEGINANYKFIPVNFHLLFSVLKPGFVNQPEAYIYWVTLFILADFCTDGKLQNCAVSGTIALKVKKIRLKPWQIRFYLWSEVRGEDF